MVFNYMYARIKYHMYLDREITDEKYADLDDESKTYYQRQPEHENPGATLEDLSLMPQTGVMIQSEPVTEINQHISEPLEFGGGEGGGGGATSVWEKDDVEEDEDEDIDDDDNDDDSDY